MLDHSKDVIVEAYEELKNSCSHYSGNGQRFKVDVESPTLPEKDVELLYHLIERLLYTSKITRPDIQACVIYIFKTIELLPMNCYKNRDLDIDILFLNKTQTFLMLSLNSRCIYFRMLLSRHNKYILNKLQQIIQSQRLKNISIVMEGIFKNMFNWIYSNLHIDLIKYMTDSQVYTSKNLLQVMNELMKQEVKSDSIQCYNIHHESILLGLFT